MIIDQKTAATVPVADAICGAQTVSVNEWVCFRNGAKRLVRFPFSFGENVSPFSTRRDYPHHSYNSISRFRFVSPYFSSFILLSFSPSANALRFQAFFLCKFFTVVRCSRSKSSTCYRLDSDRISFAAYDGRKTVIEKDLSIK